MIHSYGAKRIPPVTSHLDRFAWRLAAAACCFAALLPSTARAAYSYTKIADTLTTAPGTANNFTDFNTVAYDGQNIAFIGTSGANNFPGVYQWNGTSLSKIAFVGDPVPSTTANIFTNVANVALDNGVVAFQGASGPLEGVYTNLGGNLRRVADTTMTMPGSTALFRDLFDTATPGFDVALDDSTIYFSGFGSLGAVFDEGVYRESGGSLSVVANRSTTFPGQPGPSIFYRGEIDADAGHVVFEPDGLYTTHGAPAGSFRRVFDRNSTLPDLTPPLSIFAPNTFSIDDGSTAFVATSSATFNPHLYIQQPHGTNRLVVDQTQTNPVTGNPFSVISQYYSLDNGRVLFSGWSLFGGDSVDAIYLSDDTSFAPIISDLDTLDSKNLTQLNLFKDSLVDRDFVFEAAFNDGSRGVYLATYEPDAPTESVTIAPTFDVQLRPGNQFPIGDGQTTLVIDGGSGTAFPVLQVLAEFPLNSIPPGAELTAAELRLDALTSITMTVNANGYIGDGLASLSDEHIASTLIGSKQGTFSAAVDIVIPLDTAYIQSLLGQQSHLGLRLTSATVGPFVNIAASEHATGLGPQLFLTFALPILPGDYNDDGTVDAADYVVWRNAFGQQADSLPNDDTPGVDQDDYQRWKNHFGETSTQGGAGSASSNVPEPATASLLAIALCANLLLLGSTRRAQRTLPTHSPRD